VPATDRKSSTPVQQPASQAAASGPQPVQVLTSPAGATAMLDGQRGATCITPCTLPASPGHHTVSVSLNGYQIERRDLEVGAGAYDLPPIILNASFGTLLLSSDPPGAAVTLNGKRLSQVTPTSLQLSPGTYNVAVEKGGRRGVGTVIFHGDETQTLRLILGQ